MRTTLIQRWLKIDPQDRPLVYAQVYDGTELSSLSYWLGIVFSAGIATFGLIQDSPAVIIGAMLISPLMGPIMATGLGLALGDVYLSLKAILNLIASVAVSILFSAVVVSLLPFHSATGEILSRTDPTLLDLGIANLCGLAGSVGVGRAGSSGLAALPGVAIAVALMPPLCTVGFGVGSGFNTRIMSGAALLFLTNLVAIISSAFAVFLLVGMNASELVEPMRKARQSEPLAERLSRGVFGRTLAHFDGLGWRILLVTLLLGATAVPLKSAFVQLTREAAARAAVQQVVKNLLPPGDLVSQQVEVGRNSIAVRLFSTKAVPEERQRRAERAIEQKAGRSTELSVTSVASQSDLTEITNRPTSMPVSPPAPPAPMQEPVDAIRKDLLKRFTPVLSDVWPPQAPLASFDVALGANGVALDVQYECDHKLSPIALDVIEHQLQNDLKLPSLKLNARRIIAPPEGATRKTHRSAPLTARIQARANAPGS